MHQVFTRGIVVVSTWSCARVSWNPTKAHHYQLVLKVAQSHLQGLQVKPLLAEMSQTTTSRVQREELARTFPIKIFSKKCKVLVGKVTFNNKRRSLRGKRHLRKVFC